jgi:hypothetical protein
MLVIAGAGAAFHFGLFDRLRNSNSNWAAGYNQNFVSTSGATSSSSFVSTSTYGAELQPQQQLGAASL